MAIDRILLAAGAAPQAGPGARLRGGQPYPIAAVPPDLKRPDAAVLLFCGDTGGGWRPGAWSEGAWRDLRDPRQMLQPSHFALASGWTLRDGAWVQSGARRRLALALIGAVVATWLALMVVGQLAYGDPWALCAPSLGSG